MDVFSLVQTQNTIAFYVIKPFNSEVNINCREVFDIDGSHTEPNMGCIVSASFKALSGQCC